MRFFLSMCCMLLLPALTGCDSHTATDLPEDQIETSILDPEAALDAVQRTNEARSSRRQCGNDTYDAAPALTWNNQLAEAALAHSADMARRGFFKHENPEGEGPGVRIARTGYDARTWGENIAAGYATIEQVMAGWLNSPGHCANIMNGNFTEFAVVSAESSGTAYGTYWTMVLAAR